MEPHSAFNTLDYIVIGTVLLSGLLALIRGLMRELFSLVAWAGASYATVKYYPVAMPMAHHYIKSDKAAEWAAMGIVFAVVLVILMIIGAVICSLIKGRALTSIDRSLGFVYGLARGVLVVSVLYMVAVIVLWPDIDAAPAAKPSPEQKAENEQQQDKDHTSPPEILVQAKTRPAMAYCAGVLKDVIPKEMLDKTLKAAEEKKSETQAEADKAAKQGMLDKLSTPAPPGQGGGGPVPQESAP